LPGKKRRRREEGGKYRRMNGDLAFCAVLPQLSTLSISSLIVRCRKGEGKKKKKGIQGVRFVALPESRLFLALQFHGREGGGGEEGRKKEERSLLDGATLIFT